ncbi:porin [Paraburkholderia sediminicola]|uniref:porin n=1 Tax=Paraburkholderia sediminicola TaxID=458836 RepID=UPI0038BA6116
MAHAESTVTLYGVLDSGILYKTQAGSGGNALSLASGGESTDRWGLIGAEDLGGGWRATFALESAFRINNGAFLSSGLPPSAGTVMFDRGATVGLKNSQFGALLMGKNLSPLLRTLADLDVTDFSNFGSLNNLLFESTTGYSGFQYSWVDNSVEYQIPEVYGLRGWGLYSFGGTAGNFQSKRVISAGLTWRFRDFLVGGAYFSGNDATGATNKATAQSYTLGANYKLASFRFAFDFANFKNIAAGTSTNFYTGEIGYQLSPFLQLSTTYIRISDQAHDKADGNLYKVGGQYLLSKRTLFYADVGYVKNSPLGSFGVQNSGPIWTVGKNQLAVILGVRHSF